MDKKFSNFAEFYAFYLQEHSNRICRRLHFIGTCLVIAVAAIAWWRSAPELLWVLPVVGYGFAWVGHFFFERNRPATFRHPFYSLMGDFVMWKDILLGKIRF